MQRNLDSGKMLLSFKAGIAILGIVFGLASPPFGKAQSQAGGAAQQTQAAAPLSFEVASIKPTAADNRIMKFQISPGGRFTASGITAKMLIQQAYDLRDFQISGGPGWLTTERYDIAAKSDLPNVSRDQLRLMLQSLLAERFKLQIHRETKELPVYELVVGKNGHKLHESEVKPDAQGDKPQTDASKPRDGSTMAITMVGVSGGGGAGGGGSAGGVSGTAVLAGVDPAAIAAKGGAVMKMGGGKMSANAVAISTLASMLSQSLGRPVLDKTGLTGKYDIELEWSPDETQRGAGLGAADKAGTDIPAASDPSGPTIFMALQDQLGLKLEVQKGAVEVLIIDYIEKASGN